MSIYDVARNKTRTAIVESFWKIYCKKDISHITVKDITESIGIHRATFYLYYDNIFAVLVSIKNEQLEKLRYVCNTYTSSDHDYADFLKAIQKLYNENESYLKPLLCQYRENEFAIQYRQIMKNKLRTDIGWKQYPKESDAYLIIDSILDGMIETFISCLQTRSIPLERIYRFASQSVNNGIAPALEHEFGIHVYPPVK